MFASASPEHLLSLAIYMLSAGFVQHLVLVSFGTKPCPHTHGLRRSLARPTCCDPRLTAHCCCPAKRCAPSSCLPACWRLTAWWSYPARRPSLIAFCPGQRCALTFKLPGRAVLSAQQLRFHTDDSCSTGCLTDIKVLSFGTVTSGIQEAAQCASHSRCCIVTLGRSA